MSVDRSTPSVCRVAAESKRTGRASAVAALLALLAVRPLPAAPIGAASHGGHPSQPDWPAEVRRHVLLPAGALDGRAVRIEGLRSNAPAVVAAERIAEGWRRTGDPVLQLRAGAWTVVSRLAPDGYRTAQLVDARGGGSIGYLSGWPERPGGLAATALPAWWPARARHLSSFASTDGSRRAVVRVGAIDLAPSAARGLFAARLAAAGWRASSVPAGGQAATASRGDAPAAIGTGRPGPPIPLYAAHGRAAVVVMLEPRPTGAAFVIHETEETP